MKLNPAKIASIFILLLPSSACSVKFDQTTHDFVIAVLNNISVLNNIERIKDFLIKGVNPNIQSWGNETALHFAANGNNMKLIELLLDYGASTSIQNFNGETPLDIALCGESVPISNLLFHKNKIFTSNDKLRYISTRHNHVSTPIFCYILQESEITLSDMNKLYLKDTKTINDFTYSFNELNSFYLLTQFNELKHNGKMLLEYYKRLRMLSKIPKKMKLADELSKNILTFLPDFFVIEPM